VEPVKYQTVSKVVVPTIPAYRKGTNGVTFVICCHNSELLIADALDSVYQQSFPQNLDWEVLVIDNASTDSTSNVAKECWGSLAGHHENFKVIHESKLGVGFARYRGIKEAQFEYICYVDDDNQLDKSFTELALHVMTENPSVAACGSSSEGEFKNPPPYWFENHKRSFAVGDQADSAGDVTWSRGILWTAGMILRKSAIQGLLEQGFQPKVTGAQGSKSLLRSEDSELCLALRLGGWNLWFEPRLKVRHMMPENRLTWVYLRKLLHGVGYSHAFLLPYIFVTEGKAGSPGQLWWESVRFAAWNLIKKPRTLLRTIVGSMEGNTDALWIVRSFGLLMALLTRRAEFIAMIVDIRSARWVKKEQ